MQLAIASNELESWLLHFLPELVEPGGRDGDQPIPEALRRVQLRRAHRRFLRAEGEEGRHGDGVTIQDPIRVLEVGRAVEEALVAGGHESREDGLRGFGATSPGGFERIDELERERGRARHDR